MNQEILKALKKRGVTDIITLENKLQILAFALKSTSFDALNDKNLILAMPSIDKGGNSIKEVNEPLFLTQWLAAQDFHLYLTVATNARVLGIVKQADEVHLFSDIADTHYPVDYLILLYKFIDSERRYIEKEIRENYLGQVVNEDMKIIELY